MANFGKRDGPNYSVFRYLMDLIGILDRESDERVIKKIKKLKAEEAKIFLENWRNLYWARRDKLKHLCITNIKECNQVIDLVHREYRHLGIRIP